MINFETKLSGEYRLVIKRNGEEIDTGWFKNLILNQGLDQLGTNDEVLIGYARVGTGTTAPVITNTTLEAQVAASESGPSGTPTIVNSGAPNYTTLSTFEYTFTQGAVTGNISEVGVGWATTGATLFSRALIVDGSGTPTTITLTAIDQLIIYYRLNASQPITDTTTAVSISSVSYPYTIRTAYAASFCGNGTFNYGYGFTRLNTVYIYGDDAALGVITGSLSGTLVNQSNNGGWTFTYPAYTPGSYYRDSTFSIPVNLANPAGGIGGIQLEWGAYSTSLKNQIVLPTPILKTNTQVLTITCRFTWARL